FKPIEIDLGIFVANFELLANLIVEIFQKLLSCLSHRLVNFEAEFELKIIECRLDLFFLTAPLINGANSLFEVYARLDSTQYFITRSKYSFEQFKFLREKLIYTLIGFILAI